VVTPDGSLAIALVAEVALVAFACPLVADMPAVEVVVIDALDIPEASASHGIRGDEAQEPGVQGSGVT